MHQASRALLSALLSATLLVSGCVAAPAATPAQFTPSPVPPTATLAHTSTPTAAPSTTPTRTPTKTRTPSPDSGEAFSVANIQSIEFLGRTFELRFTATDQPVQIYEYFLPDEGPSDWFELVQIQIYPVNPDGNEPIDFANRTADAFIQQYPDMRYAILTDSNSDEVILHFFYPTSTREGHLEFAAFKFFNDPAGSQVMALHYAKNIESFSSSRTFDDVLADITKTQEEVVFAMAEFDLFDR